MQELMLAGHLYQKILKERLQSWMTQLKYNVLKLESNGPFILNQVNMLTAIKCSGASVDRAMDNFLSTGNLTSKTGLGLMQSSGFVILAENLNRMRYMSHFR